MWSFWAEMNINLMSDSLFLTEQIQKQVVSLKRSYLSIDIKYVGVLLLARGSTWKIKSEMLLTAGNQCICGAMA